MKAIAIGIVAMFSATSATAITYVGNLTVGHTTASFTVTTDGTIGILSQANFLSTSGTVTSAFGSNAYANGNFINVAGAGISATATQLLFDTNETGFLVLADLGSVFSGICYAGGAQSCAGNFVGPQIFATYNYPSDFQEASIANGVYLVASAPGAVPEPASWALLIAGFGLTGAAMRRRRMPAVA
jgi:hypothetical protein